MGEIRPDQAFLARHANGAAALACLVLFVTTMALLSPGRLGPDEAEMLRQAQDGNIHNWHSALLSGLWRLGLLMWPGTGSIHALEVALYFLGVYGVAAGLLARGHRSAAMAIIAFSIFPLTWIALAAAGSKDVFLSALMLCAAGMLNSFMMGQRRLPAALALVVIVALTVGVRQNGVFAALPLLVCMAWAGLSDRLDGIRRFALSVFLGGVVSAALLLGNSVAQRAVGVLPSNLTAALFIFDLAGISAHAGVDASQGLLGERFAASIPECYDPVYWDPYAIWGRCPEAWVALFGSEPRTAHPAPDEWAGIFSRAMLEKPGDADVKRRLFARWANAVAAHPFAYAQHRLAHFRAAIGLGDDLGAMSWVDIPAFRNPVVSALDGASAWLAGLPVLSPAAWLLTSLIGVAAAWALLPAQPALIATALHASALAYGCAYLFIGVAWSFRYFHWTIVAAFLGIVWTAAGWSEKRRGLG